MAQMAPIALTLYMKMPLRFYRRVFTWTSPFGLDDQHHQMTCLPPTILMPG